MIAGFSSSGPTPISLQMKPDVTAPGVDILSSLPGNQWSDHDWSGTSMASPHVAGAAALLKQRHPAWTVAQIKSALESTGDPVHPVGSTSEVTPLREGGGRIDLPRADNPLVFTDPTGLSFGLVKRGATATQQLALTDAGGGPGAWNATVASQAAPRGVTLALSAPVAAAGTSLGVTVTTAADAAEGDATGFVLLTRGTDVRRVPYWLHVEVPQLAGEKHATLSRTGLYGGNTAGKPSRVSSYRYPEGGLSCNCTTGVQTNLSGPEQVFRFTLKKPVANFGAVVVTRARGVRVSPRLVVAGDENRLVGYTGDPGRPQPVRRLRPRRPGRRRGLPAAGAYDFVFDTPAGAKAGKFTFRFWVNDTTPPRDPRAAEHRPDASGFAVTDKGSGVDPASIVVKVDGTVRSFTLRAQRPHDPQRHARQACGHPGGLRLPGGEEHGERRADPAEHADVLEERRRPLAPLPPVLVLGRRQVREVALDARREVVGVRGLDDAERRLPLRAVAAAPRLGADARVQACTEPRPLRTDHDGDGQCEQGDVQPAHCRDLTGGLNRSALSADMTQHERPAPRAVPLPLGDPDARPPREGARAPGHLRPVRPRVRAADARRERLPLPRPD